MDEKIKAKLNRKIIDHPKSIREMILSNILKNGSSTISQLKADLGLEMKDIRYNTLRLAQMRKLSMIVGEEEPVFSPYIEE